MRAVFWGYRGTQLFSGVANKRHKLWVVRYFGGLSEVGKRLLLFFYFPIFKSFRRIFAFDNRALRARMYRDCRVAM